MLPSLKRGVRDKRDIFPLLYLKLYGSYDPLWMSKGETKRHSRPTGPAPLENPFCYSSIVMKTNPTKNNFPTFCPACDAEGDVWETRNKNTEQVFRGESFSLPVKAVGCKHCGFTLLPDGESERLVKATWGAYRKKYGLLTAGEIRVLRKGRNMTQKQFADYLGVGEASVKRWERGLVQDRSSDQLIRAKTAHRRFAAFSECYDFETVTLPAVSWAYDEQRGASWAPLVGWSTDAHKAQFLSKDVAFRYWVSIRSQHACPAQASSNQRSLRIEDFRSREVENYDFAATA